MVKVHSKSTGFKKTVVFFTGFRKTIDDFEEVETFFRDICNVVLIELDEEDYLRPISQIGDEIRGIDGAILLFGHSYGAFYCVDLAIRYPKLFSKVFLIDPTTKTEEYRNYLLSKIPDKFTKFKLDNFESFPLLDSLPNSTIIRIVFQGTDKIAEFDRIIRRNVKSRSQLFLNMSHMIHHKIPHVIIDWIREYLKI